MTKLEPILEERAVAFLDILGFQQALQDRGLQRLMNTYIEFDILLHNWEGVLKHWEDAPSLFKDKRAPQLWADRYIFSDAIVLFSRSNTEQEILRLLVYVWRLLQFSIIHGLPIRGALAFGEIALLKERSLFVGQPIIDAYLLEEKQQWVGVSIDRSLYELAIQVRTSNRALENVIVEYAVPFKGEETERLLVLNWCWNLLTGDRSSSSIPRARSDSAKVKFVNTLLFQKDMHKEGKVVPKTQDGLPVELAPFCVGEEGIGVPGALRFRWVVEESRSDES